MIEQPSTLMKPHEEYAARLVAIVESSDDAIVSTTLDGIITSWNRAAAEAIGQPITLIIPDDRRAEARAVLARVRRGDTVDPFETVWVAKDGRRFSLSLIVSSIKDSEGRILGVSAVARDLTERDQVDIMRARLAAIIDSSDDAIVSKTLDGIITSWNRAAERIFGYTAAEAIGRPITLIIPEERRAEEDDVLVRIRRGESVDHFDTVRVRKDGQHLDISLTVSPIRDAGGRIVGASKIARDVTDRKRAERERSELLMREQAARAEAEALNRSKDEFLAVLSHELRTPLNAIYGWARMLESGRLDRAATVRATEAILRNATAQVQLIEDLLDISRIITGNLRLDVRPMDLKAAVDAALDSVRPAASAKDIRVDTMLDPRAAMIIGAPDRLQQVVWNLLMNAVKFTPRGGRVQVRLVPAASGVEIVVNDTGEGVAPDVLPYVFDRFRQGDSSSTRVHGGLGIGLALVRHLVELHGGSVNADSPGLGRGATFTVTLPVRPAHPQAPPVERPVALTENEETKPPSFRGVRVLVVDDDVDGLDLASVILTNRGAEVRTATSAAAALEILQQWPPDILVSDLAMPIADGVALLGRIRALEVGQERRLPAVALTAYGRSEDRIRVLAAGFSLHVVKPVDPAELAIAVASVVGRT